MEEAVKLDPTNALIGKLVYIPVPVAVPANGLFAGSPLLNFTANLNLLDYTVGKPAPADAAALALQLTDQLKRQLAAALERNKVTEINPAAGTKFDPHQHQAISVGQFEGEPGRDRAFEMTVDFGLGNHANPRSGRSGRCSQLSSG